MAKSAQPANPCLDPAELRRRLAAIDVEPVDDIAGAVAECSVASSKPHAAEEPNGHSDSMSKRMRRAPELVSPGALSDAYRGYAARPGDVPPEPAVNNQTPLPDGLPLRHDIWRPPDPEAGLADEFEALRVENAELRKLVEQAIAIEEELERSKAAWAARENELAENVKILTHQVHELEEHVAATPPVITPPPTEPELAKMADEIDSERARMAKERKELDEERKLFRDDEESMMKQMRGMEVQMAKERAEMARQRAELQRMHAEVRAEQDSKQRGDAALKDRMAQFQRRSGEPAEAPKPAAPKGPAADLTAPRTSTKDSSIIRRFFGRK